MIEEFRTPIILIIFAVGVILGLFSSIEILTNPSPNRGMVVLQAGFAGFILLALSIATFLVSWAFVAGALP